MATIDNTAYLFNKETKYLLPISLHKDISKELVQKNNFVEPSTFNSIKRMLTAAALSIPAVIIYKYKAGKFYAYVNIRSEKQTYDINTSLEDALCLSDCFNSDIYVKDKLLKHQGIQITKELIEQALVGTPTKDNVEY